MIRRQTLEETLERVSLFGCATAQEETYCDIDRVVVTLDAFSDSDQLPPPETLRLLREKLFHMARRLEETTEALYAHARLAQPVI